MTSTQSIIDPSLATIYDLLNECDRQQDKVPSIRERYTQPSLDLKSLEKSLVYLTCLEQDLVSEVTTQHNLRLRFNTLTSQLSEASQTLEHARSAVSVAEQKLHDAQLCLSSHCFFTPKKCRRVFEACFQQLQSSRATYEDAVRNHSNISDNLCDIKMQLKASQNSVSIFNRKISQLQTRDILVDQIWQKTAILDSLKQELMTVDRLRDSLWSEVYPMIRDYVSNHHEVKEINISYTLYDSKRSDVETRITNRRNAIKSERPELLEEIREAQNLLDRLRNTRDYYEEYLPYGCDNYSCVAQKVAEGPYAEDYLCASRDFRKQEWHVRNLNSSLEDDAVLKSLFSELQSLIRPDVHSTKRRVFRTLFPKLRYFD